MGKEQTAPVLIIVGRPNVGKSTLFNRLVKRRDALVDPTSGLTRDLRKQSCLLGSRSIILMDSAGLIQSAARLTKRMTDKSLQAVEEANIILFVIDGQSGLLPEDEAWAKILRTKAKQIILIANKCENQKKAQAALFDVHRLGLGEPLMISAEHHLGIGDLERAIIDHLPKTSETSSAKVEMTRIRLAVIGRPNVGKSSLINHLLGEHRQITSSEAGTTRDATPITWQWQDLQVELYDTAGLRRRSRIFAQAEHLSVSSALQAIRFADIVLLLMDAERLFESQDLRLADLVVREGRALVLAVNKIDLAPHLTEAELAKTAERLLPQARGLPVLSMSAKTGKGVEGLMPKVMVAADMWNRTLGTAQLNSWLQTCIARHPPPAVRRRPVRIKYITQKSARPPSFVLFTSHTKKLPEDYKRFLINDMRLTFGFAGTPIRLDVRASVNPYI